MARLHYASTHDSDMLYLVRHRVNDPFIYLETDGGSRYVFLSATDLDAFRDAMVPGMTAVDCGPLWKRARKRTDAVVTLALVLTVLEQYKIRGAITVPRSFPLDLALGLRERGRELVVAEQWCPERVVKTHEEITFLADNAQNTCEAFRLVEGVLRSATIKEDELVYEGIPLTSERVKLAIETFLLTKGMDCAQGLIVSCGAQAAMPHHSGTGLLRPHQTIIVDIFPQSRTNNYFADMTRTYVKGTPSERVVAMYKAVRTAQEAAKREVRPGLATAELFEISAQAICVAGFEVGERGYIHSLGHGLGVAVHEAPGVSGRSKDILVPGHVITLEPGLYYPEHGGVRIEDTVVVTETGVQNLTNYPKELVIP